MLAVNWFKGYLAALFLARTRTSPKGFHSAIPVVHAMVMPSTSPLRRSCERAAADTGLRVAAKRCTRGFDGLSFNPTYQIYSDTTAEAVAQDWGGGLRVKGEFRIRNKKRAVS